MKKHFQYDGLIIIDGDLKNFQQKKKIIDRDNSKNFLSTTFNSRNFSISEINKIRTEIELLDLDHILFSIRPSFQILKRNNYHLFLQIVSSLKLCNLYDIKNLFIDQKYEIFINNNFKLLRNYLIKTKKENTKKVVTFFSSIDYKDFKKINLIKFRKNSQKEKKIIIQNDINQSNKKLFWLGFDRNFTDVPWASKYPKDKWYKLSKKTKVGSPIFKKINYCSRCCLPETWEGISFDNEGICTICKSAEDKMIIEWKNKERELNKIFNKHKNNNYYDCLLPISGGKDSTFQSYVLTKKYNLNPLAITHGQNWFSITGRENLENCLNKFDLDHIFFCASRKKINNVAKSSLKMIGDACWHCHIGAGTFAIQSAFDWKIRLIVYGEGPADTDARGSFKKKAKISPYRFLKISAVKKNKEFVDKNYSLKKLSNWSYPDDNELKKFNPEIIHLGQYMFWDEQKNIDFVSKYYGWKNTQVENTYKGYKSNECVMAGVHDYFNFLKRGIGRATVHASDDVRRGLITREQGFELAKKFDIQKPHALKYYKKITNYSDNHINKNISEARQKSKYAKKYKL